MKFFCEDFNCDCPFCKAGLKPIKAIAIGIWDEKTGKLIQKIEYLKEEDNEIYFNK